MSEPQYDLELILPVSGREKYAQRLEDFKNFGLLNVKDKKVRVDLLVGPDRFRKEPHKGWPDNVEVFPFTNKQVKETPKVYHYISSLKSEDMSRSRWYAKFDDDSINDVSALVDLLDLEYDHEREYYIVTELRPEQHKYEDNILRAMGFERWFRQKNVLWHELEGSVVSQAGMRRITSNKVAMEFMQKRAGIAEGYSDYALACAARISKIYPSDAYFISKDPAIGHFTLLEGHLAHIHNLSHDRTPHAYDLLQRMMNKKMHSSNKQGDKLYKNILNQEFIFKREENAKIAMIRLKPNGIIARNPTEERIWHITDSGNLEFLAADGTLRIVFDNFDENHKMLEGYFAFKNPLKPEMNPAKPFIRRLA